ncbi:threonine-phosphate decarboxylase CobD [Polycyclovorans algicola]|uniref:threonine-phosphate decarboxylase CobD n=1 Tax=Polycyclovorans algicola TaxID=616992 RepID=UPI0004A763D8|nr:threonine-phosphate decarboxylase CobD [Polycyclovorans algicola]
MLEHGGRLRRAAHEHGIPLADWLDLSTGISPWSWLGESGFVPSPASWLRLPEDDDGLAVAAADYFGAEALPVAGSQAAIQALPTLRAACRVGVLSPSYNEHAEAWRRAGHSVLALAATAIDTQIESLDVLLMCNPNNPDGQVFAPDQLLDWHARLATRGGWLVVDEAFIDATPAASVARCSDRPGLMVLRSLGKFFGLAGARVGFALCEPALRHALRERLGPWPLAGPAREVAARALQDHVWQQRQIQRLSAASADLATGLRSADLAPTGGCALFQQIETADAPLLHAALARQGILVRAFAAPGRLRLGLPGDAAQRQRLQAALANLEARVS